jgi:hypothetical protein
MAAVVAAAALPIPLLLRRAPVTWSLPGFAPLAALAGAGPAYVAIAGQGTTWAQRAALGALGWLWIVLARNDAIDPLPYALTALAFAAAAVLLPILVRGLRLALDLVAAGTWAAALYAALLGIQKLSGPEVHPRSAAVGAAAAAAIAVAAAAARRSRGEAHLGPHPVP